MPDIIQELEGLTILQKRILKMLSCGAKTTTEIRSGMRFESIARTATEISFLESKGIIKRSAIEPGEYAPGGNIGSCFIYYIPDNNALWKWIFTNI